jgi:hypothetical protein
MMISLPTLKRRGVVMIGFKQWNRLIGFQRRMVVRREILMGAMEKLLQLSLRRVRARTWIRQSRFSSPDMLLTTDTVHFARQIESTTTMTEDSHIEDTS